MREYFLMCNIGVIHNPCDGKIRKDAMCCDMAERLVLASMHIPELSRNDFMFSTLRWVA